MDIIKVIGVIATVIAILSGGLGLYYGYVVNGDELSIVSLPSEVSSYGVDEDVDFSFFVYNSGDRVGFVDYIYVDYDYLVDVESFSVKAGESQEVNVKLIAPGEKFDGEVLVQVWSEDKRIEEKINARWQ